MADLPPLKYGKVVGRFLANTADGPDLDDLPEFPALSGTVTFAAAAPKVLVAGAQPSAATYVQLPKYYECELDEFGYLTWRGRRGVRLVAPDAAVNPTGWTWRVSFDLRYEGDRVPMEPYDFAVGEYVAGPNSDNPDVGSTGLVDLTLVSPVPSSAGNAIVQGKPGLGLQIDGQVPTYAQLPARPADRTQYVVQADGLLYIYRTETGWMPNGQGIVIRGPAGANGANGTTTWAGITDKPRKFVPTDHSHVSTEITDTTAVGRAVMTAVDAAAARTAIDATSTSDPRLSDARDPKPGSVTNTAVADGALALAKLATGHVKGVDNTSAATTYTIWVGTEAQFTATPKDPKTIYLRTE